MTATTVSGESSCSVVAALHSVNRRAVLFQMIFRVGANVMDAQVGAGQLAEKADPSHATENRLTEDPRSNPAPGADHPPAAARPRARGPERLARAAKTE